MEICAAIHALRSLWFPSDVVLYSDSLYLLDGATSWIPIWERGGWMTKKKKPVKNADLWRELKAEADRHCIRWLWVKGHSGNVENERADKLATTAANSAKIKPVEKDLFAV